MHLEHRHTPITITIELREALLSASAHLDGLM
eukprot:CAMPEP_0182566750 /NCGR_PEP_ID=MMETSP1324-20130603/8129_1 /TAXON_ID=236786 /ORGANISM="Florenciella sp., Strain RCC1587" /LENGTH=31 /DNA_ID= /DNA_START= /DNA_END= /DNA_ORIENTATION=